MVMQITLVVVVVTVGDLFFRRVNRDLSPIDRFQLMGLTDAVPVE